MTGIQALLLRAMTVSFVVVVAAAAAAAATTRNTNDSLASGSGSTVGIERQLQLTFQPMAGYTPKSLVTDVVSSQELSWSVHPGVYLFFALSNVYVRDSVHHDRPIHASCRHRYLHNRHSEQQ